MSSPPSMLIDRLINASDGADARSTIAECCSLLATATTDETFHSFAKSFLDDTSFLVNALSLLTNCKLSSTDTFVSEGSSEICQLFIQLLTSPLTTSHTRSSLAAKVLSFATESGTNQSRGIVASLLDMVRVARASHSPSPPIPNSNHTSPPPSSSTATMSSMTLWPGRSACNC